jgi:hypothetical protein
MNFDRDQSVDVLARTPSALQSLLGGLTDPWIRGTEGPDTFSPFDVVGHLIDGEETDWMPRARIILARGASVRFEPYDRFRHRTPQRQSDTAIAARRVREAASREPRRAAVMAVDSTASWICQASIQGSAR